MNLVPCSEKSSCKQRAWQIITGLSRAIGRVIRIGLASVQEIFCERNAAKYIYPKGHATWFLVGKQHSIQQTPGMKWLKKGFPVIHLHPGSKSMDFSGPFI